MSGAPLWPETMAGRAHVRREPPSLSQQCPVSTARGEALTVGKRPPQRKLPDTVSAAEARARWERGPRDPEACAPSHRQGEPGVRRPAPIALPTTDRVSPGPPASPGWRCQSRPGRHPVGALGLSKGDVRSQFPTEQGGRPGARCADLSCRPRVIVGRGVGREVGVGTREAQEVHWDRAREAAEVTLSSPSPLPLPHPPELLPSHSPQDVEPQRASSREHPPRPPGGAGTEPSALGTLVGNPKFETTAGA